MALLQVISEAIGVHVRETQFLLLFLWWWWDLFSSHASCSWIWQYKTNDQLYVNHLLFTDDLLIFFKVNKNSVQELNKLLNNLHRNTGSKSIAFFSKGCSNKSDLALYWETPSVLCKVYIWGLPLTISYIKARHFPLIDKCRAKVECWMLKKLSFTGRVKLIQWFKIQLAIGLYLLTYLFQWLRKLKESLRIS